MIPKNLNVGDFFVDDGLKYIVTGIDGENYTAVGAGIYIPAADGTEDGQGLPAEDPDKVPAVETEDGKINSVEGAEDEQDSSAEDPEKIPVSDPESGKINSDGAAEGAEPLKDVQPDIKISYEDMKQKDLKEEAKKRGLSVRGSKQELIDRLKGE